jgi:very-short-patch-repair endonuclease
MTKIERRMSGVRAIWRPQGYRVLRFWNTDVMRNIDGVVEAIAREVGMRID